MAQIFHRSTNTISKVSIFGAVFIIVALAVTARGILRSPYMTEVGVVRDQPVPFSHQHHVAGLGIDCRYCHTSVEDSSFAGIPPTKTCMNCHSQVWSDSPTLEPVRSSYRDNRSIAWTRVHDLADFVYFDHSIHIHKGVGCVTCHGQVNQMQLMWRDQTLHMEWCLDCHRQPAQFLRPRDQVFAMNPSNSPEQQTGEELAKEYQVESPMKLTNCSICHR